MRQYSPDPCTRITMKTLNDVLVTLVFQDNGLVGLYTVKCGKRVSTFRANMLLKMKTPGLSEGLASVR
jgi:hypothetical protein